jgi:hypothetical protein
MQLRGIFLAGLIGAFASPLAAQTICGGAGDGGQWIGGAQGASDITTTPSYLEQMALVLGGNDYVALFTLSAETEIRLEAAGRGAGDPLIDLLDENGDLILSDDDSGGNAAARAEISLDAGTYCMAMRSYDGGPMTAFVRIGRLDQDPLTDGINTQTTASGSCADAQPMGPLGSQVSAPARDTGFWAFTLDTASAISITAENNAADPLITLYDAQDGFIAENDDFDGLNARIDVTSPLDAGDYCIAVTALSDDTLPITIKTSLYDPAAALMSLYARGDAAPPIGGEVPITDLGTLASRNRQDIAVGTDVTWFSLTVPAPSLLLAEAIGTGNTDPWLVIFDDLGRQIGINDDHGDTLNSLITARVQSGQYLIGLRQYEGGSGFARLLLERYVLAE